MTTDTATTGKSQFRDLIEKSRDFIAKAAPKHVSAERLMNMALTAYSNVPGLRECWTPSVIGGVVQASMVGLELNTPLGQAYLIPFNDRKSGKKIAQFIIGYKGLIKLMQNSGALTSIHADKVCANDTFEYEYGSDQKLRHIPATGNRGAVTHFYCYVKMKDGGFQMEVMPKSQVDSIMAKSPTRGEFGPWKDHYEEMGIKTAIRRIAKYVPLSAEVANAIQVDAMGDAGLQDLTNLGDGHVIEGELEPERPQLAGAAPTQQAEKPARAKPGPKSKQRAEQSAPAPAGDGGDGQQADLVGDGTEEPIPPAETGPAEATPLTFEAWMAKVDAASPEQLDELEDMIRDMKPAIQGLARREIERKRNAGLE